MKSLLKIFSFIGLLLTVVPSFLVFYNVIEKHTHFVLMGIGVIVWFVTAPFWMRGPSLDGE